MDPGDAAKEDAVFGHREIDARGRQHGLGEKAEGGKGDARGDERAAAGTKSRAHYGRGGSGGGGESCRAKRADANEIDGRVDCDDAENAEDQAAGKRLARIADFAAKEAGGLPSAVGEEDWSHRGTEREREAEGGRLIEKRAKRDLRGAAAEVAEEFEHADGGNGGERHGRLHAAAGAYAKAVDGCEQGERSRSD